MSMPTHLLLEKLSSREADFQRVYIGQAPLDSLYISLLAYGYDNVETRLMPENGLLVRHGAYESLWTLAYPASVGDAWTQRR